MESEWRDRGEQRGAPAYIWRARKGRFSLPLPPPSFLDRREKKSHVPRFRSPLTSSFARTALVHSHIRTLPGPCLEMGHRERRRRVCVERRGSSSVHASRGTTASPSSPSPSPLFSGTGSQQRSRSSSSNEALLVRGRGTAGEGDQQASRSRRGSHASPAAARTCLGRSSPHRCASPRVHPANNSSMESEGGEQQEKKAAASRNEAERYRGCLACTGCRHPPTASQTHTHTHTHTHTLHA